MVYTLAFVVRLVLVFTIVEQLLYADSAPSTATTTYQRGGITAKLIHRDQYFADENDVSTTGERLEREARRSMLRVEYLQSKQELAVAAPSSNPAPGSADWETPLSDVVLSAYLMEIVLGTPPQKFMAIADTGSDLSWVKCAPCQSGCETGSIFQPTKSSTYLPLACSSIPCVFLNESGAACPVSNDVPATGCGYGYAYGDGSVTKGELAMETITLQTVGGGSQTIPDYWFGCSIYAVSNTSLLTNTDGLIGLGRGNISFPTQLGKYFGSKFGYCLVNRSASTDVAETPLFFGSDAVPNVSLQYTALLNGIVSTFYYVGCEGIGLNGKTIGTIPASAFALTPNGTGGFIFDSGTTFTALTEAAFTPFIEAIQAEISSRYVALIDYNGFKLCYIAAWTDWVMDYGKGVPVVSFQLTNTTGFTLAVDNVWLELDSLTVCMSMQKSSSDVSIFGNVQQMGFHVLYDLENQQIGFVKADCTPSNAIHSNSQRTVVSLGTSLVSALLSLLLLLELSQ